MRNPDDHDSTEHALHEQDAELTQLRQSIAEKDGEIERLLVVQDQLTEGMDEARDEAAKLSLQLDTILNDVNYVGGVQYWIQQHGEAIKQALASALTTERMRDAIISIPVKLDHSIECQFGKCVCWIAKYKAALATPPSPALAQVREALEKVDRKLSDAVAVKECDNMPIGDALDYCKDLSAEALTAARDALALMGGEKV